MAKKSMQEKEFCGMLIKTFINLIFALADKPIKIPLLIHSWPTENVILIPFQQFLWGGKNLKKKLPNHK